MTLPDNTLVIVPARGGSKRIPHKNIKHIGGQPMIHWPLMALSKIAKSHQILLSTDDDTIAKSAEAVGLTVPFRRPKELSDDYTGTVAVATHALKWYEDTVKKVEYAIIVYPTAVLLNPQDIVTAFNTLRDDPKCDSVMSASHFPFPIQRAVFENEQNYAEMFQPDHYYTRSQDLVPALQDAGQFYVCRADTIREGKILTNSNVKLHILHKNAVIDIDTPEDLEVAEAKLALFGHLNYDKNWSFTANPE